VNKSSIVFLSIPTSLKDRIQRLELSDSILIPVEFYPEDPKVEGVSWEMVLSGMLRVISAFAASFESLG
jgi:hypothetical protein